MSAEITVEDLAARRQAGEDLFLLDVREPWEVAIAVIAGAVNIPLATLPAALDRVPAGQPVVAICHHGMRSAQAACWLETQGRGNVVNLLGGIDAWARHIEPGMPVY